MSEPFIGEILLWAPNFSPRGWAFCHGQLLAISGNEALFSILGTTYGGDGRTTFGLPDLRSRVAIHQGQGPGLGSYRLGEKAGVETVTINANQLPSHTHVVTEEPRLEILATTVDGNQVAPSASNRLAAGKLPAGQDVDLYSTAVADTTLGGLSVTGSLTTENTGGNSSHDNMQPWQGLNFIIALVGTYPSRN